ncbi:MAG: ATP-binding protein, partial [Rectinema sp.]|nr:ATP-binding protein [Rectinema sp.]
GDVYKRQALLERVRTNKSTQQPPIRVEIEEKLFARGDPERIERVIGHLVQNALDATAADGQVWLILRRHGGLAEIEIGDTGCGMSPEFIRERLFRPFITTKEAGMGIGAYESRQYIREIGGDIRVESEENHGTRFYVTLPILDLGHDRHHPSTSAP